MTTERLVDASNDAAKNYFLKGSSYFKEDFPGYISFEPILKEVRKILNGKNYRNFQKKEPGNFADVNYSFLTNKDGRFSWRPYELMHPAIYISLVDLLCTPENWSVITKRLKSFENGVVDCCSSPLISCGDQSDQAAQVRNWWQSIEQKSIIYSLEYSHVLHTDVTDCYGSIYTHSISWALHGLDEAKRERPWNASLGNIIGKFIQDSRYAQTNGISQGSVVMDFIAEIILGYVDSLINEKIEKNKNIRILRYRDDYRIFSNSDKCCENTLKIISEQLMKVGMKLNVSKTSMSTNIVEASIKADKLAGINLQDLGDANAKTVQKYLLRLHSFGRKFPNSGALRRLTSELHLNFVKKLDVADDLEVQIAIATDIAVVSPITFPAIAGILSSLIAREQKEKKKYLWEKVVEKMKRVPYNGYLEIWLQRVTIPKEVDIQYTSSEAICQVVNGGRPKLWGNEWVSSRNLINKLDVSQIITSPEPEVSEIIDPKEIQLFAANSYRY